MGWGEDRRERGSDGVGEKIKVKFYCTGRMRGGR